MVFKEYEENFNEQIKIKDEKHEKELDYMKNQMKNLKEQIENLTEKHEIDKLSIKEKTIKEKSYIEKELEELKEKYEKNRENFKNKEYELQENYNQEIEKEKNYYKNMLEESQKKHEEKEKIMKNEMKELKENKNKEIEEKSNEKSETLKTIYEDREKNHQNNINDLKKEIENLKKELFSYNNLENENKILKEKNEKYEMVLKERKQKEENTNQTKKINGEENLYNCLDNSFENYEIIKCDNIPESMDIHIKVKENIIIGAESKYKKRIDKTDIEKFERDINSLKSTQNFIGAIFASIKTKKILNKGCDSIELYNGIPILYVGYENEEEMYEKLPLQSKYFVNICLVLSNIEKSKLEENYYTIIEICKKNKKLLEDSIKNYRKSIKELKTTTDCLEKQHIDVLKDYLERL